MLAITKDAWDRYCIRDECGVVLAIRVNWFDALSALADVLAGRVPRRD